MIDFNALPFAGNPLQFFCLVLLLFWSAGMGIALLGLVGTLLFKFRPLPPLRRENLPGVSIIKPCFDNRDNEAENFEHFFTQDYPGPVELLFTVSSENDPIVPTVREYIRKHPGVDAKFVLSTSRNAFWNKINSLHDAQDQAKHEIIIWSDSDVVVKPNYVSEMVACLQEPGVSVVTTPQYDFRADNFPTHLKVLANNCDDATFMMAYNLVIRKKRVALGHSIGFKASEFNEFKEEAWDVLSRFMADDLALPYLFANHGKKVVFRNVYCPVQYSGKNLSQVIDQKRRWVMCQKQAVGNRALYLMASLFYPAVPGAFLLLATGFSSTAWVVFGAGCAIRIFISAVWEGLFLGSLRMSTKYFWTVPIWDLMQVGFVIDGFFRHDIILGGKRFRVDKQYFLKPIE